ncbi:distal tail protein Dit [Thermoflavimicrobium dichotomicum]|uniref:Putative phage tail component, N-terminal domain-containing protein n=1 Tax=Thermoflavimicrobium dichotomicum TaxID=46223 RepID=A0A1I3UKX2_9BACL|nr:distal tail protein Dit [Thermoflavimicrobium dichotomicum]SFJ83353.1 putative phage tail component, N-terminal domain-containing protein [Thermoflavimicrobium dichotomicum]
MSRMTSFYFNGKSSSEFPWLLINRVNNSILPPIENKIVTVPGKPGFFHMGRQIGHREEKIKITILADSREDREAKKRILAQWLNTDTPQTFYYSYEQDKEYKAILDGETDLERIVTDGEAELTFLIPDPHAYGATKSQTVAVVDTKEDTDVQSEWSSGTLNGVVATANGLQLQKEGQDFSRTFDFSTGTKSGTVVANGALQLKKGLDIHKVDTTDADWNTKTGGSNTTGSNGNLVLTGLPNYTFLDHMADFASTGWSTTTLKSGISQQPGYVRLEKTATGSGTQQAVYRQMAVTFPCTIDIRVKTNSSQTTFYVADSANRYNVYLPNTNDVWKWFRVVATPTDAKLYEFGNSTPLGTFTSSSYTSGARIGFIVFDNNSGTVEIDVVYHVNADLGTPPASWTGTRINQVSLGSVVSVLSSSLNYEWSAVTATTDPNSQSVLVEVRTFDGTTWSQWFPVESGQAIPGLTKGSTWGTNSKLEYKISLITTDPGFSPAVTDLSIDIISGYQPNGTWESESVSLSQVGRAASTLIGWVNKNIPSGTTARYYTALSTDGGNTWGSWQEVTTSGSSIPQINSSLNLATAYVKFKVELSTTDVAITPEVTSVTTQLTTAYKTTGERISTGVSINIEDIYDTYIGWDVSPNGSPDVEIYVQLVDQGNQPTPGGWIQVLQNPTKIPGITQGSTITNKKLYTKQVLKTSNPSSTPTLHRLLWWIKPFEDKVIEYEGTAKAYPKITVTFKQNVSNFYEVSHFETGNKVLINRSFSPNDVLVIDNSTGKVTLNGVLDMASVSIDSDFFYLNPGTNTINVTPTSVAEVVAEWRERFI